jgi:hypothetical protein
MTPETLQTILRLAERSQQPGETPLDAFHRERCAWEELDRYLRDGIERGDISVRLDQNGELRYSVTA